MSVSSEPTPDCTAMVVLPAHLHARPAGALVQAVARFASTVELTYQGRTVNARGVLGVGGFGGGDHGGQGGEGKQGYRHHYQRPLHPREGPPPGGPRPPKHPRAGDGLP